MDMVQLRELMIRHGLKIDGLHAGAGRFRDLEIGVGALPRTLAAFAADVRAAGHTATVTRVTNHEHPDFAKAYVEIPSFWYEE